MYEGRVCEGRGEVGGKCVEGCVGDVICLITSSGYAPEWESQGSLSSRMGKLSSKVIKLVFLHAFKNYAVLTEIIIQPSTFLNQYLMN